MSAGGRVPGLNNVHLHLSGPVLAGIYSGHIMYWDDAKIKDINREYASKLPHKAIVPIHRADGSGDTFLFTQYFSKSTPSWASGPRIRHDDQLAVGRVGRRCDGETPALCRPARTRRTRSRPATLTPA